MFLHARGPSTAALHQVQKPPLPPLACGRLRARPPPLEALPAAPALPLPFLGHQALSRSFVSPAVEAVCIITSLHRSSEPAKRRSCLKPPGCRPEQSRPSLRSPPPADALSPWCHPRSSESSPILGHRAKRYRLVSPVGRRSHRHLPPLRAGRRGPAEAADTAVVERHLRRR
jgi:hypothetical protein